MKRRVIASFVIPTLLLAASSIPGHAKEVVGIVLHGRYYSEPANVRILVDVEPDASNRTLVIEADSPDLFRSSETTLSGANEKRKHTFVFMNLPAGHYMVRAEVRSASEVRGSARSEVVVTGIGLR